MVNRWQTLLRKHTELLAETCNSVTEPFGYTITNDMTANGMMIIC